MVSENTRKILTGVVRKLNEQEDELIRQITEQEADESEEVWCTDTQLPAIKSAIRSAQDSILLVEVCAESLSCQGNHFCRSVSEILHKLVKQNLINIESELINLC